MPLQTKFASEMEKMLCTSNPIEDDAVLTYPYKNNPVWVAIDEIKPFTVEDAQAILKDDIPKVKPRPCPLEELPVMPWNYKGKGKMWMFRDLKAKNGIVVVDGELREMTEKELSFSVPIPIKKNRFGPAWRTKRKGKK